MGFVDQNLMPGETITYRATLHWIIFGPPVFLGLLALLLVAFGTSNKDSAVVASLGGFLFMAACVLALSRLITLKTSEFAITNKRVLIKVGFIRRHSLELLLTKVEGIGVDQGILGRILGYGTIVVAGTGGTKESFQDIAEPLEFRKHVQAGVAT